MNTLLIGYGGIAREVLELVGSDEDARIAGILVRENRLEEVRAAVAGRGVEVGCALDDFTFSPDLCAECAGHGAVREWGIEVLGRGIDFLVVSIGVLADGKLHDALAAAARAGGAKMILAAGAVAGTDALAAARAGGLESVVYTSRKPPGAWKGTPAEAVCDLDSLTGEVTLYAGPADEAARRYPQNANVAATVALAGAGLKATEVRLVEGEAQHAPGLRQGRVRRARDRGCGTAASRQSEDVRACRPFRGCGDPPVRVGGADRRLKRGGWPRAAARVPTVWP